MAQSQARSIESASFPWYADRGFLNLVNRLMIPILRSPFHRLASKNTMLITFTGRRTGKQYATPVSYFQEGNIITFFTPRSWIWWKNLQGNVSVTVHIKGHPLKGTAEVVKDQDAFVVGLKTMLQKVPRDNLAYRITIDSNGLPNHAESLLATQKYVMLQIKV